MCISTIPGIDTGKTSPLAFGKIYTIESIRFNGAHPHNQLVSLMELNNGHYYCITRFRLLCDDELRLATQ